MNIRGLIIVSTSVAFSMTMRPCLAAGSIVWERKDGPFFSRAVLWDPANFTDANLRSFYAGIAAEMQRNRAWDVKVFVDRNDLTRELYGKLVTDKGYEWWKDLHDKFGRGMLPMAELLGYRENTVMRVRDGHGVCSEVVLAGRNFLHLYSGGVAFDILESYYHPLPPDVTQSFGDQAMVSVFVRASRFPTVVQARALSKTLRGYFLQKRVTVAIRTDSYFLTDSAFPILYRFDQAPDPPSRVQYELTKTMYCFGDRPGILCNATP